MEGLRGMRLGVEGGMVEGLWFQVSLQGWEKKSCC